MTLHKQYENLLGSRNPEWGGSRNGVGLGGGRCKNNAGRGCGGGWGGVVSGGVRWGGGCGVGRVWGVGRWVVGWPFLNIFEV